MRNTDDNKDRFGYGHRSNGDHNPGGDPRPGTPGHSKGVYHDGKNMPTVSEEVGVDKYYSDNKEPDQHMRDEVKNNE